MRCSIPLDCKESVLIVFNLAVLCCYAGVDMNLVDIVCSCDFEGVTMKLCGKQRR